MRWFRHTFTNHSLVNNAGVAVLDTKLYEPFEARRGKSYATFSHAFFHSPQSVTVLRILTIISKCAANQPISRSKPHL